jgi:DNA-binding NtrC family response regulator
VVELTGLPDDVRSHRPLVVAAEHVRPPREVERDYIEAVLERNHGNRKLTARQLEIAPATLFGKLEAYADVHVKRPGAAPHLPLWPD